MTTRPTTQLRSLISGNRCIIAPGVADALASRLVTREGFEDRCRVLRGLSEAGRLRYPLSVYQERLDKEIGVIRRVGFAGSEV